MSLVQEKVRAAAIDANLAALRARGLDLDASTLGRSDPDARQEDDPAARAAVESATLPWESAPGRIDPAKFGKPVVVEGVSPPWLLLRVWKSLERQPDGYAPAIFIIQRDESEFLEGLARADLTELLADERIHLFVGAHAEEHLAGALADRIGRALPLHLLRTPGTRRHCSPPLDEILGSALSAQQAEHERLIGAVRCRYAARGRAARAARFGAAAGAASPARLRILLPISRFSTFVRHSAADLAEALQRLGHETLILTEPDDHSRLASVAYLRAFDTFEPDLVTLINYTRAHMGAAVPADVPLVTWVQDRMPQLFDPRIGAAQGGLDFLFGHLHAELFAWFGYPKDRARFSFVPASARKFHDGPLPAALLRRHACDVAYVSHQSETPEEAHARLIAAFASQPAIARAAEDLFTRLSRIARGDEELDTERTKWSDLVAEALAVHGVRRPDERLLNAIVGNYVQPIAERLHRHTALGWAARICERRGWRLALYGRGWERHPALAPFARGPLDHDESLRAAYRAARCHLHIARSTNAHQRIAECALSGGLMLRRGPSPDHHLIKSAVRRVISDRCEPVARSEDGTRTYEPATSRDPELRLLAARYSDYAAASRRARGRTPVDVSRPRLTGATLLALRARPNASPWAFPDLAYPAAHETLFHSEPELEHMIARAVEIEDWRDQTIAAHRDVARRFWTYDAAAESLLELVRGGLSAEARA